MSVSDAELERTLLHTRLIAAALLSGVVLFAVAAGTLFRLSPGPLNAVAFPVGLAGLIAPVVAYRLYGYLRERGVAGRDPEARLRAFQAATTAALSVTEGVALLGVVVYLLSADAWSLVGVVSHVLMTGAVWPSRVRLENFLEAP